MKNKIIIKKLEDRKAERFPVKMAIFGPPGIGKTSLLKTLSRKTLCLDLEAGMLAVQDWEGDSVEISTWEEARDIACVIGGPNKALKNNYPYSQYHYEKVCKEYATPEMFHDYECLFIDSITVASRLCFQWCQNQPEVMRNGRVDTRAAYGLLGREMIAWITQIQHIKTKDVIMVGVLEQKIDEETKQSMWTLQCEGSKTAAELPGILDEVICMVPMQTKHGVKPVFVCKTINNNGYPAKDRSGLLETIEEANLDMLLYKIQPFEDEESLDVTMQSLCDQIASLKSKEELNQFGQWFKRNFMRLNRLLSYQEISDLRKLWQTTAKLIDEEIITE